MDSNTQTQNLHAAQGSIVPTQDISGFLDEVYFRISPEQVYEGVFDHKWKKTASKWRGCCPFHDSKSGTSFYVTTGSLTWYCPQCKTGGNPIQYLYQVGGGKGSPRGKEFVDLAKFLGDIAGVEFPERELTAEQQERIRKIETRQAILETVYGFCHEYLTTRSTKAIDYLTNERGFNQEDIETLQLGIFPKVDEILAVLTPTFSVEDLLDNHIIYKSDRPEGGYFSPMTGYITLPWRDDYGRPLTMYGRWHQKTPPGNKPKTNALKNPGSNKSPWLKSKRVPLYLDRALSAGHKDLIVVEGVLDAAMLQARGETRAIAWVAAEPAGDQIQTLVRRKIESVTFCLDPDGAGDVGTESGIKKLTQAGITTYAAPRLPDNQDPDEFVIRHGIDHWYKHIERKIHGFRFEARWVLQRSGAAPYSDTQTQKILEDARSFARQMHGRETELDVYFWSEIQEATGVKEIKTESNGNQPPTGKDKISPSSKEPKDIGAGLSDRAERLKNELQFYLKEPDPVKRLILRNDVCASYRITKQDFSDQIADLEEANNPKQKSKFDGTSFFGGTTEAIDYYISRYLPVGESILLCSDAGVGKSALITDMIHASLAGGEFLGEKVKHAGRTLVISSDESPRSTRRRFIARGIDLLDLSKLDVWTRLDITRLDDLEQYLEDKRPDVVFIDSITTVCLNVGISEKDPEFARYLYKLKNLVNRYGASLVVIHHANKDPLAKGLKRISGSARIPAAFWGVYLLESADAKNPDMPDRILEMVKGREVECFRSKITFHQRHEWQERGIFSVIDESGKEREYRNRANQVIEVLKRCAPRGMEYYEISAEIGLHGNYLYKVLDRLEDSRAIGKRRSETDKRKWVYFIASNDTPSLPIPEMTNNFEELIAPEEEYIFDESEENLSPPIDSIADPSKNYSSSYIDSGRGSQNDRVDRRQSLKGDKAPKKPHRNPSLAPDARSLVTAQVKQFSAPTPVTEKPSTVSGFKVGDAVRVGIDSFDDWTQKEIIKNNECPEIGQKGFVERFEPSPVIDGAWVVIVTLESGATESFYASYLEKID